MLKHKSIKRLQSSKAKHIIDQTMMEAAKLFNVIIIVDPINESAYQLLMEGLRAKPKEIIGRTSNTGIARGYVLSDPNVSQDKENQIFIFKPLSKHIGENEFKAIVRNEKELWVKKDNVRSSDRLIEVIADDEGRYLTADLDLMMIGTKDNPNSSVIFDYEYGYITNFELEIIKKANAIYSDLVSNCTIKKSKLQIITHGPYNRYIKSKKNLLKFPIKIFLPFDDEYLLLGAKGDINQSITKLERFIAEYSKCGFHFYLPEHWR